MYFAGQPVNVQAENAHCVKHFRAEFAVFLSSRMLHQALKTEYLLIRVGDYRNVSIADKGYDGTALANLSNVDLVGILLNSA